MGEQAEAGDFGRVQHHASFQSSGLGTHLSSRDCGISFERSIDWMGEGYKRNRVASFEPNSGGQ
jgi:hypothetical protein